MADRLDIQQVLGQMRGIRDQMQVQQPNADANRVNNSAFAQQIQAARESMQSLNPTDQVTSTQASHQPTAPSFGDMFESAFQTVNNNQQAANNLATRYEQGDPQVDLPEVMIALQKSSVSFQAMTQVRNKMVEAYKEVMNMPI